MEIEMTCSEKGQKIAEEVARSCYQHPPRVIAEPLYLPSCGLMGDNKVYGYAWNISGIQNHEEPEARKFAKEIGTRLTNEVTADDGTRFVRVFLEIMIDDTLTKS